MKIKWLVAWAFVFLAAPVSSGTTAAGFCDIRNTTTQHGEQVQYTVYYSVAGIYVNAGEAAFSNQLEKLNGRPVYHIVGKGQSNSRYDWIYKVRDRYESYIDTANMQPLRFLREVQEGRTRKSEDVRFHPSKHTVSTDSGTVKVPPCIQDVLSTIYFARNIDFSQYKKNDKIPFDIFLENRVHSVFIRYLGREKIKTSYGRFSAIKFSALLVEGTIFSGGENMTAWVTDDGNRLPVRIESSILIGSIKVDMSAYANLRHPLSSLESRKSK